MATRCSTEDKIVFTVTSLPSVKEYITVNHNKGTCMYRAIA